MTTYRQQIRALREDHDYTQTYIASLLNVGQRTYADYELGKTRIPIDVFCKPFLQKIAKHLCRLLQSIYAGCCTYILQVIAITFAGRLRPAKSIADILITDYFALFLDDQKAH